MDRRTAARVFPTAEPTASTCSSNSPLVFTPVVPVDHAGGDQETEDGQKYVLHPPSPMRSSPQSGTPHPFRSEMGAAFYAQHRRGQFFATERADPGESREGS